VFSVGLFEHHFQKIKYTHIGPACADKKSQELTNYDISYPLMI